MERLTGLDAAFLYLENNVHHMHVAMTTILDPSTVPGGYSFEKLKAFIGGRVHLIPPFRQRLLPVPLNLAHPLWVEDPHFDLDYHIRRIGAPAPGGRRELGEMAGQIASTPLDRSKPLWELWVVENLKQGRIGVVTKVHHSTIDGASGAELMVHLFDLSPEYSDPEPPQEHEAERIPNDWELLGHAAASRFRQTLALPKLIGETVGAVQRVVAGARDPDMIHGAAPLTAPRTHWNGALSADRDTAFARVSLEDVRAVKNAFDCTVNDVVLAICAGTLRSYLLDHDDLPDTPLVATCPISVRTGDDLAPGNKVSAMFTELATDTDDPAERIRRINVSTKGAKEDHNAVGAAMLGDWAEYAAPNLFNLASRLYSSWGLADSHRPVHNVIISNVPGPQFPLYYAGAEMVAVYPLGPVMEGVGLNISVMSYNGSIDFGFIVDGNQVTDIWNMADRVKDALRELQVAAGLEPGGTAPTSAPEPTDSGPAKKTPAKKTPAKKAPAKKAASRKKAPAMAVPADQPAAKRTPAKKAAPKKAAAKKAAGSKKTPAKQTVAKKAPAKKSSPS